MVSLTWSLVTCRSAAARRWPFCLAAVGGAALAGTPGAGAGASDSFAGKRRHQSSRAFKPSLLLVSFDGFRADYLDRLTLPNFRRIMARGVRRRCARSFPRSPFPTTTTVTGLYPGHHGIVENTFFDPVRGVLVPRSGHRHRRHWYGGEPIWVTGERQGMVTACFFWPDPRPPSRASGRHSGTSMTAVSRTASRRGRSRVAANAPTPAGRTSSRCTSATWIPPRTVDRSRVRTSRRRSWPWMPRSAPLLDGIDALPDRDRVILLLTSDHGMATHPPRRRCSWARWWILPTSGRASADRWPGFMSRAVLKAPAGPRSAERQADARPRLPAAGSARTLPPARDPRAGDVIVVMDEGWTMATGSSLEGLIQTPGDSTAGPRTCRRCARDLPDCGTGDRRKAPRFPRWRTWTSIRS